MSGRDEVIREEDCGICYRCGERTNRLYAHLYANAFSNYGDFGLCKNCCDAIYREERLFEMVMTLLVVVFGIATILIVAESILRLL